MNYQEILSHFTYDDSTDIRNRAAVAEAGDYRENRDIINEIVLWKMNRRPQVTEELIEGNAASDGKYGVAFLLPGGIPYY